MFETPVFFSQAGYHTAIQSGPFDEHDFDFLQPEPEETLRRDNQALREELARYKRKYGELAADDKEEEAEEHPRAAKHARIDA